MEHETMWEQVLELVERSPLPEKGQDVFLFGGGLSSILTIPMLKSELNLVAVCDNDTQKQEAQVGGLPIVLPKALKQYKDPFVLISSCKHFKSMRKELLSMDISHCNVDTYVMHQNLGAFQEVYRSLDRESQRIYAGVLCCRLLGEESNVEKYCSNHQYFCLPKFRYIGMRDTFIDCGAFTGDIVQKVVDNSLGLFRHIYAFEPNAKAYSALKKRATFLQDIWALDDGRIVCEQKGVGAGSSRADFRTSVANLANMSVSVTNDSQGDVEIVALDDYIAQHNIEKVTFLKSDIEGSEWDMLHGAAKTIQRDKPNLAISIYHNIFDFYRIYQYVKELVPEYTFVVRHHWNSFDETVLYCYLENISNGEKAEDSLYV